MLTLMRDHVKSLVNYDNINYTFAITVTLTALREKAGKVKYEYAFNPSSIYPHRVSSINIQFAELCPSKGKNKAL